MQTNDGFYEVYKEKLLEGQVERLLQSRRYSRKEIAYITNASREFVDEVHTRTNAKWIVKLFKGILNTIFTLIVFSFLFGLVLLMIFNSHNQV